ncbi:MAG: beta-ketoacyl-ACP synthase II [Phycisphaeraceae bacterium]|nr:beta-ketoacyl-ACP synthase II [Phycisphaeraceae bacterium]MCB9847323.1 beta-ketoacyl-ACP synthase II [Phycisphaeraceae bacterium]
MTGAARNNSEQPRIVVTGVGAITNLGLDAASTWDAMVAGRSGISMITGAEFDEVPGEWPVRIAGQIHDFDPEQHFDVREARRLDRVTMLGIPAAVEAVSHSGIDFSREDPERCGVVIGSGIGGISTIEQGVHVLRQKGPTRLSPFTVPKLMVNSTAGHVSIRFGLHGPSSAHATACASSGHSIGEAVRMMQRGEADVMIAGGTEGAVTPICISAFTCMKALSSRNDAPERASRPFDKDRDGFVLSEGAACLLLETLEHARARGAEILAEIAGYAASSDGTHITAPDEQGRGAARSMTWALKDAGLTPTEIDYVNAHGTSTPLGDAAEVNAALAVFGDHARKSAGGRLVMSSTKSMHGHCLGASGSVEALACLGAIRHGVIPPTINLDEPDEGFDLEFAANTARDARVNVVMNNTFGFGGHNVTLIFRRYQG